NTFVCVPAASLLRPSSVPAASPLRPSSVPAASPLRPSSVPAASPQLVAALLEDVVESRRDRLRRRDPGHRPVIGAVPARVLIRMASPTGLRRHVAVLWLLDGPADRPRFGHHASPNRDGRHAGCE